MVTLNYPGENTNRFFAFNDALYGPMDGNLQYVSSRIPVGLRSSRLDQRRGIHGENHVKHSECDGVVEYYPIMADCVPFPSSNRPRQMKVPLIRQGVSQTQTFLNGFAVSGFSYLCSITSLTYEHYGWLRLTTDSWRVIHVIAKKSDPRKMDLWEEITLTLMSWANPDSVNINVKKTRRSVMTGAYAPFPLDRDVSYEQLAYDCRAAIPSGTWNNFESNEVKNVYRANPSYVRTPSQLADEVDMFAERLVNGKFPIDEVHYGNLAMSALEEKRRITGNMLEFLRDLRHCKDLIPKLSNLGSLKGLSDQFLAVKYGILPTVSDLKSVIAAFKARKPYLDKNGYETFSAGYRKDGWMLNNQLYASLEQHVKVAVANEDSDFERLLETLDDFGVLPTFENLWDLVKYSFVVDWFVDVGSFLERFDTRCRIARYNIQYATCSRRLVMSGYLPGFPSTTLAGRIYWRHYHRWVQAQCPLPPLTLEVNPFPTTHWVEGTALLMQRL